MSSLIGARIPRLEDEALLRGKGRFVDDVAAADALHANFVRSPHPHALIRAVSKDAALAVPGVRAVLTLDDLAPVLARPFAAPPGIPADRKAALIAAFDQTMKDPEFLSEAQKLQLDVNPVSAKSIDEQLAELYATPKDVIEKAAQAIAR